MLVTKLENSQTGLLTFTTFAHTMLIFGSVIAKVVAKVNFLSIQLFQTAVTQTKLGLLIAEFEPRSSIIRADHGNQ